jgi:hypothetical protein
VKAIALADIFVKVLYLEEGICDGDLNVEVADLSLRKDLAEKWEYVLESIEIYKIIIKNETQTFCK